MKKNLILIILIIMPTLSYAENKNYFQFEYGESKLDSGISATAGTPSIDEKDKSFGIIYGYNLKNSNTFLEFGYIDLGFNKARMNACGYSLGSTFSPNWMDWPMLYTGNPYVITPGNVFFMHMILMDSDSNLAMNLGETYLVTENGNERLGKQKLDLVVL